MPPLFVPLDPQPDRGALPARLPSPFDPAGPHPLALRAAERLRAQLEAGDPAPASSFVGLHQGKMFGVLVVARADGRVGFLRGFSGMVDGRWEVPGFVGPTFDAPARDAFWPAGEAELDACSARIEALTSGPDAARARSALTAFDEGHEHALEALRARHRDRRSERARTRQALAAVAEPARAEALHALAQASCADKREERELLAQARAARDPLAAAVESLDLERASVRARQTAKSRELLDQLYAGYRLANARGETKTLYELFAPHTPPGGAGDCAGPKLFAHAIRHGLRPLALTEFWWGTPPVDGGRRHGVHYPSCRGKCGPVLGHMLGGLDVEPAPLVGAAGTPPDEPRTVFEDRWIVVVDKPTGLLSVPGRSGLLGDSVLTRLRARHADASAVMLVHRLDVDVSGLLLAAKDAETHAALQAQFWQRTIDKRYAAWLQGDVRGDEGTVDLPLRVDFDDRPRQIHDPVYGKRALTHWQVRSRADGRTRVTLRPITGRSHQLRVHAADPRGLNAPIVGDRLYGASAERLMLHAERLTFTHPQTGAPVSLHRPAPFE